MFAEKLVSLYANAIFYLAPYQIWKVEISDHGIVLDSCGLRVKSGELTVADKLYAFVAIE